MKKILGVGLAMMVGVLGFSTVLAPSVHAQGYESESPYENPNGRGVPNIDLPKTETGTGDGLVNVVKGAVNWTLGILALIALIVVLYGGFLMVTASGNEDQYNKGFIVLKQAAIGLILIGLAWFIISMIFWLVNLFTTSSTGGAGTAS